MTRYSCPHCGERTFSILRRLFLLSPARPTRCPACDREVGVPWWSLLVMSPVAVCIVVTFYPGWGLSEPARWLMVAMTALSFASSSVAWLRWVPLERR